MKTHGTIRAVVAIVALLAGGTVARAATNPVYATRIAAVANNTFLVKADGTAWACGDNTYGQIGDGTSGTNRFVAVQVSGLSGVTNISAGAIHAVALKSDGNLWEWGGYYQDQLGFGIHPTPVQVSGISDVKAIAVGFQGTLALKSNGSLWHWGYYNSAPHSTPADTGIAGVSQVACSENTRFVVKGDGTAWGWGVNYYGMIGNNTTADQATPVQVLGGVSNIAAGMYHTVALKSNGTVWAWGYNNYGQLGDGTSGTNRLVPVQVSGLTGVVAIAAGGEHTVAVKGDGTVWAWGKNWNGQLGIGVVDYNPHRTPVQVAGGLTGVVAIAAGTEHTVALKGDGTVWVWGYNNAGQLGDGTVSSRSTPVQMVELANMAPIAYHLRTYCLPNASVTNPPSYYDPDLFGTWTAVVVTNATHGTVVGGANLVYTPTPGFTGIDSFTYKVNDGKTNSNFATGYVNVRANGNPAGMLVDIVVNDLLYTALSNEVQRLKADLTNEGYTAIITPVASGTSAGAVWTNLNSVYQSTNKWLVGALFIGDVAKIVYDGTYSDGYYWNMHQFQTSAGAVGSHDIWVGRFTISGSALGAEADLIRYALDANHYYRTGQSRLPNTAYVHVGNDWGSGNPLNGDAQAATEVNRAKQVWTNAFVDSNADGTLNGVNGSDLICELSHGNHNLYTAGMTRESAHAGLVQSRAMLCTSCGSGYPDGVVNHQLFSRGGGNLISVGASIECNPSSYTIFRDDNAHLPAGQQTAFRSLLAAGEIWGQAMLKRFPFPEYASHSGASCTMIYGDLSIRPLATPTNAMPAVTSFTASKTTVSVGEPVTFTVAVSDPDTTACTSPYVNFKHRVEWYTEGWNYGINNPTYTTDDEVNSNTKTIQYTKTFASAGTRTVRALVMDEWRAVAWQEITVTVQSPLVTCAFTAPTNGAVVREGTNLTITADATATYGSVSNVEFTLDGLKIATDLSAPFRCVWTNAVAGAHVLTAKATDGAGNVGNATAVSLSVLPITTCTITAPANGTVRKAGTDLSITATAAVLAGTVSKVEFFHDGVKIGEDLSAPYACVWSNVPIGSYALTARATQSAGRTGDAAAVTVNATASGSWEGVFATGGTVTNYTLGGTNYRAHIFTTVGSTSITFTAGGTVEYLVIGGGGGGNKVDGSYGGGGGGAGGYRCSVSGEKSGGNTIAETPLSVAATTYAIYVGAGGAAGINGTTSVLHTVISQGGGAGGKWNGTNAKGFDGACGGGGTCQSSSRSNTGGSGTPNQGFGGGSSVSGGVDCGGGGGGGGQIGQNGTGNAGGAGGTGIVSFITGQYVQRGGGGGGGGGWGPGGAGGAGGGGAGGTQVVGSPGANAFGGGGGGGGQFVDGGAGGSGIVVVRYVVGGGGTTNQAPTAIAQSVTTAEDTAKAITLAATDADGDARTCAIVANPAHGTLSGTAPSVTYTPAANYAGADSFTFRANDGKTNSNVATVSITVTAVNDAPTVTASGTPTSGTAPLAVSFTATGADVDGGPLSYAWTFGDGTTAATQNPSHTYAAAGTYTATVTVSDGKGGTASANVAITVTSAGGGVSATGGTVTNYTLGGTNWTAHIFTTIGSTSITFTAGGTVEYLVIGGGGGGGKVVGSTLGGGGGGAGGYRCSVSGEKSGGNTIAETPLSVAATTYAIYVGAGGAAGINGTTSVFHTVISQGGGAGGKWNGTNAKGFDGACGGGGTCHLSSRINTGGSGTPNQGFGGGTSVSGGADCGGGGGGVGQIGQNGTGGAGGAGGIGIVSFITGQYVQRGGGGGGGGGWGTGGAGGAGGGGAGGTQGVGAPGANTFGGGGGGGGQYVDGGAGGSGIVVVRYVSSGGATNQAPKALAQSVTTAEDTAKAITLTGTDPEASALTYTIVSNPAHGTLSGTGASRTYTPAANYNGADSFTFKVNDGALDSPAATISLTVTAVNDNPTVTASGSPTSGTAPLAVNFTATGADVDGDTLSYAWTFGDSTTAATQNPSHTYAAAGAYTATVTVSDGKGGTASANVTITVTTQANQPPVANAQSVTTAEDTAKAITLTGSDPEASALTYTVVSSPAHGTLSGTGASRTYTPAANYNGSDTFTFKVNDGALDSTPATVSITVTSVNDAPVAMAGVDPAVGSITDEFYFWATDSYDVDGTIIGRAWQINGTVVSTNADFLYTFAAGGAYTVTLTVWDNAGGSGSDSVVVNVSESITPVVSVSVLDGIAGEPGLALGSGRFQVSRIGDLTTAITVNYVMSGTAGNGTDYTLVSGTVTLATGEVSRAVVVNPLADALVEGVELSILTLADGTGYTVDQEMSAGAVMIQDQTYGKPTVTAVATDAIATEPGLTTDEGSIEISRTGSCDAALTVLVAVSGTAVNGVDYSTLNMPVVLAVGQNAKTLTIIPKADGVTEGAETVVMTIQASAAYAIEAGKSAATVTITE